jgi:hypothetical protein
MGEGSDNLVYLSPWDFGVLLHAVKSYDMGPPALLPIPEEGVLWIFIALKKGTTLIETLAFGSDFAVSLWTFP